MPDTGASPVNFPIIVGDWRLGYELIRIRIQQAKVKALKV